MFNYSLINIQRNITLKSSHALTQGKTMTQQIWNSQTYATNARFVADLGLSVVEWLNPQLSDRILDLGCGDGALTIKLKNLGCEVVGVDASEDLIATARSLGLDAHVMDGHYLAFDRPFDAVFSNAALHWMQQPEQVIAGVTRSLKPGGRFVGEFGGAGNVATIHQALMVIAQLRENGDSSGFKAAKMA
jgi:trans-aconitate methyltransferase